MSHSGRYAALNSAYMAERGENSDEYELETLTVQPATSGPAHAPVMPSRYHRMLDSFLQGKGGSEDSDSDSETTLDGGAYDGDAAAAPTKHRGDSFELLFSKQRPRNGHKVLRDSVDDKDDLEAQPQPAWMRRGYISENNVLRVG